MAMNKPQRASAASMRSMWYGISPNQTMSGRMPPLSRQPGQIVSAPSAAVHA